MRCSDSCYLFPFTCKTLKPASLSWLTQRWADPHLREEMTHINAVHSGYACCSGWPYGALGTNWAPLKNKHKKNRNFLSKLHPVWLMLLLVQLTQSLIVQGDVRANVVKLNLDCYYRAITPPEWRRVFTLPWLSGPYWCHMCKLGPTDHRLNPNSPNIHMPQTNYK